MLCTIAAAASLALVQAKSVEMQAFRPAGFTKPDVAPNTDVCSIVNSYLPSECSCTTTGLGGTIDCEKTLFGDDLNLSADVEPCASTAEIIFEVKVATPSIDYSKTIKLGDTISEDIPGLTFGISGVASASAVVDLTLSGNLDSLTASVALDACAEVAGIQECGSDIDPSVLPYTILSGTFDFSNVCS